jgi:putative heme iron utilization protein
MSGVDRYGFEVVATTTQGRVVMRLGFSAPVTTPEEVRAALVAMVRQARAGD